MITTTVLVVVSLSPVRGPGPRASRIEAIGKTWGQRLRVAVLISGDGKEDRDKTLSAVDKTNMEAWELPRGDETQFEAMRYAILRCLDANVHWMVWVNDHTFLFAENLLCFLRTEDSSKTAYLGSRMYGPCCGVFNSGAAGFALSRRALELVGEHWRYNSSSSSSVKWQCDTSLKRSHIATCLLALDPNSRPPDTRIDGADIFHVYGPVRLATGAIDDWYLSKKTKVDNDVRTGLDSISPHSVSFHYVSAHETILLDKLLHDPPPDIFEAGTFETFQQRLRREWPHGKDQLGGYSHPWPSHNPQKEILVAKLLQNLQLCPIPS